MDSVHYVLFGLALAQIFTVVMSNTKNLRSALAYKYMPLVFAVLVLIVVIAHFGWITLN